MSKFLIGDNNGVTVEILETGDIQLVTCNGIMINQLIGDPIGGMPSNIYLRVKRDGQCTAFPLVGRYAQAFSVTGNQAIYRGGADGISYNVSLTPVGKMWFYDVILKNEGSACVVDVIYTQDIGLGSQGHVMSNEAYNSQYLDHKAFKTENGYVVCSRQNQRQQTGFPFLQQGCLQYADSFSVDGYPFFGLEYKFTNEILALNDDKLNNRVYQYEFAYTALQSSEVSLDTGGGAALTFYGVFAPDVNAPVNSPMDIDTEGIKKAHDGIELQKAEDEYRFEFDIDVNKTLSSEPLTEDELNLYYPRDKRRHEEWLDGNLLSFFGDGEHVVLMEKERNVERAHGHIIITGRNDYARADLLASTNYIYGVFNSQVVIGNTSFNMLLTNQRNGLNVSKIAGQRVFIKIDGEYKLLTMPAVYEMGLNYAKWLYKIGGDMIEVRVYTALDCPMLKFELKSHKGYKYDLMLYNQLLPTVMTREGNSLYITHSDGSMSKNAYPLLSFEAHFDKDFVIGDDTVFYKNKQSIAKHILTAEFTGVDGFGFELEANIDGKKVDRAAVGSFEEEKKSYKNWLKDGINNFQLSINTEDDSVRSLVERFNDLSIWYSHNARIHYASPHGLEQFGGAAWGTRDVCQGPFEFFMAAQNFGAARSVLEKVYARQYKTKNTWPQWFMFDNYKNIQSPESHGDVIVWPLKALSAYLLTTGDMAILDAQIPYTIDEGFEFSEPETLFSHVEKQIEYIKNNFYNGTCLSSYGDGDWDDTLQPANRELRKKMVSGWTVALTYQTFMEFAKAIEKYNGGYSSEIYEIAGKIRSDFGTYVIKDGITAGFLIFEDDGTVKYLLHPDDKETGLMYRLLPMTRSVIAGLFDKGEAEKHIGIIKNRLYHPDGVRLMDTTCRYNGGANTYFMRAETAANFGREIGLQYVHAHIRFIEAMAKIGDYNETWLGLSKINPILIDTVVKNAEKRQSNCYFSSSDGKFDNRYEAMQNFDRLRDGSVNVKAGWRVYSSGSGIYLNQLVSQCLGIRISNGQKAVFDPVLPPKLDGMEFGYAINGVPIKVIYHIQKGCGVSKVLIDGKETSFAREENPYREGGAVVELAGINENTVIELFL